MARIFITGSTDGLGLIVAKMLYQEGHEVVLHARNDERAKEVRKILPGKKNILIGDLSDLRETELLAERVNALGRFDVIIHNAGVYQAEKSLIFAVNVVAPYILSALIIKPKRLVYIGSNMHLQGHFDPFMLDYSVSYSDSKLQVLMLALAVARKWPDVYVNTVDPGWVPTKMGGPGAPDDLEEGARTQVWLASGEDATFSGVYLFHMKKTRYALMADDEAAQEQLLERCEAITGIPFPVDS